MGNTSTKEERKQWYSKLRRLASDIKKMSEDEKNQFIKRCGLIITCEGHRLTVNNTIFLLWQQIGRDVNITMIGGFRQWQKVGRMVQKGQHSIGSIFVPINIKKDDDGNEDDSDIRFRLVPVFDVSQIDEKSA